jgi:hypothetical protein
MDQSGNPVGSDLAGRDAEKRHTRRTWVLLTSGLLVVLAAIAVVALALSGGSDNSSTPRKTPAKVPPNVHQAQYDISMSSSWPQYEDDKPVGAYLESAWHDPASWATAFMVDSRHSDTAGSPMAAAQLARLEARQEPSFKERDLEMLKLRGLPTVRWTYAVGGKPYVNYFFEECGTHFVTTGWSPAGTRGNFTEDFYFMTSSVEASCGG